jgi:RNA polymerase sigma-70 factor (ECF subfamily)
MAIVNGNETAELVRRALEGDRDASEALWRQSRPIAFRMARRILADTTLAEDAAQESLMEAWRNLPRLRDPAAFPGFLQRIVRKQCDRITRRPLREWIDLPETRTTDPIETALHNERATRLRQALDSLPVRERRIVGRYYFDGSAVAAVAAETGEPVGTVKYRLHEARKQLRKELEPMMNEAIIPEPDAAIRAIALSLYNAYTAAFARRDAAGILSLYQPTYRLYFTNGEVMEYPKVQEGVEWEMTADLPQPRTMTFTIEEILPDATTEQFTARVRCLRRGEGVKDSPQGILRDDTWQQTPDGWQLAETRSFFPMPPRK